MNDRWIGNLKTNQFSILRLNTNINNTFSLGQFLRGNVEDVMLARFSVLEI